MVTDIFAVIADRTRRDILDTLRTGDKAVGELVEALEASQPTVSKHLKVLRDAGLVTTRAQGQKRFYALRLEPLGEVGGWIAGLGTTPGSPAAAPGSPAALAGTNGEAPVAEKAAVAAAEVSVAVASTTVDAPAPAAATDEPGLPAAVVREQPSDGLPLHEEAATVAVPGEAVSVPVVPDESRPAQLQRTVERTVERAAARATELMANLPKFGRRK